MLHHIEHEDRADLFVLLQRLLEVQHEANLLWEGLCKQIKALDEAHEDFMEGRC